MKGFSIWIVLGVLLAPVAAPAFDYDESISGDIGGDEASPVPLGSLDIGYNAIRGTATAFGDWSDGFSLVAPYEITSAVFAVSGHTGGFEAKARIFETPLFVALETVFLASNGSHGFGVVPLTPAFAYGFSAAFVGPAVAGSYDWQWILLAPEAGAGGAGCAALVELAQLAHRRAAARPRGAARR